MHSHQIQVEGRIANTEEGERKKQRKTVHFEIETELLCSGMSPDKKPATSCLLSVNDWISFLKFTRVFGKIGRLDLYDVTSSSNRFRNIIREEVEEFAVLIQFV